jgi:diguanylate cyclase (GGDEF)-like protein
MTQDQVHRYIAFVGYFVQFGSALLLCVLFYLLRRHAARRAYFSIWARAWLVMIVAMAVVILYNLPAQLGPAGSDITGFSRLLGRFSYTFTKLLAAVLFIIGTRVYAFGNESRASFVWGIALSAAVGATGVLMLPNGTRAVVLQAPLIALALSYSGVTLLRLPHSRRSLGSRLTGAVFVTIALVWVAWFAAYNGLPGERLATLERVLTSIVIYNGYVDALLQMTLGSGMVLMLMEDGKREADDARAELAVAHDKLRRDALYDSLTGSLNRRAFAEGVGLEMARATFGAVVVLDMDNLKTVNDSAGHASGDELLQHLATTLRSVVRPSDRLYRWGGDEFLLLFPSAKGPDVQARVEEALKLAEPLHIPGIAAPVYLTASVGSADYASAEDLAAAIERADGVMYRQKKGRRTREREGKPTPPRPELVAATD